MGSVLGPQNSPTVLYTAVTILRRIIHILKKCFMWYFGWFMLYFWGCISQWIFTSYFPIKILLSILSLFCRWIFSFALYEEFSFDFSTVYAVPPGVSADPYIISSHLLLQQFHTTNPITNFLIFVQIFLHIITIKQLLW